MKNIIVSGSTGYIGKKLLEFLNNNESYKVFALCRDESKLDKFADSKNILPIKQNDFFSSDIKIEESILINLAFPRKSEAQELLDAFEYTYKLYDKAYQIGCYKIINISSQSVYDLNRKKAASENDLVKPFSMYGVAKMYLEGYTRDYAKKNDINYVNVRLGSIYGPGFEQRFINKFVKNAIESKSVTVKEAGEVFSFLNVYDAVAGLVSICDANIEAWNTTYNLGAKDSYTITDIVKTIGRVTKNSHKLDFEVEEVEKNIKTNSINIDKLMKNTSYRPQKDLLSSVEEIYKNYLI